MKRGIRRGDVDAVIITAAVCALLTAGLGPCEEAKKAPDVQPNIAEQVTMKDELLPVLDSLEQEYETACRLATLSRLNDYLGASPAGGDTIRSNFAKIFRDTTVRAMIDEWRGRSTSLADKLLARRLELWHRCFLGGAIITDPAIVEQETTLAGRIARFPLRHNGAAMTPAKIARALAAERRQKHRRTLWALPAKVSAETAESLGVLIGDRNRNARTAGFPNYYSLMLYLNSIDEAWLVETLEFIEEKTREPFDSLLALSRDDHRLKEVHPWDFEFLLGTAPSLPERAFPADSLLPLLDRFERAIGFSPASKAVNEIVSDTLPPGALTAAVRIPGDVRYFLHPVRGRNALRDAFRAYGEALHAGGIKAVHPILKGYVWIPGARSAPYAAGVAGAHAAFIDDSLWLARHTPVKEEDLDRVFGARHSFADLYRVRLMLTEFFTEYEFYKDPAQDLAALERAMSAKYLRVAIPGEEPHRFASSAQLALDPCTRHNDLLAAMLAAQLQEALENIFEEEKFSSRKIAAWMAKELFADGEMREWQERVRSATGKSLEPGAYLRSLGIEVSALIHKE